MDQQHDDDFCPVFAQHGIPKKDRNTAGSPGPIAVRIVCPGSVLNGHDVFLLRFDDLFYFLREFVRELLDVLFGPFGIVF